MTVSEHGGVSSSASSATAAPVTNRENIIMDEPVGLSRDDAVPSQSSRTSDPDGSFLVSQAGTLSPMQDDSWTSSDEKDSGDRRMDEQVEEEKGTKSRDLARTDTNMSIAETLSLPREILFVLVICLAQLFTRTSLAYTAVKSTT